MPDSVVADSRILGDDTRESPDAADTADPPEDPLNAAPVDGPGPWAVGYRSVEITYAPQPSGDPRTLRVALWYPTEGAGTAPNYLGLIPRTEVAADAPPAEVSGQPVLLYSHGYLGFAEASFFLTEHFASHGWLVLAPDHAGTTFLDFDTPRTTDSYLHRSQDLTATLDAFAPDADRVMVAGHSFGGYTALALAGAIHHVALCDAEGHPNFCTHMDPARRAAFADLADPRVDLALTMSAGDATILGPAGQGVASIDVPVFLMTATLDNAVTNQANGDPYWAALDHPQHLRLDLRTGGHQTWSVSCEYFGELTEGDGCVGDQFIPPKDAWPIINHYALGFARHHLTGDDHTPLLDGTLTLHPDAILTTKP